MTSPIKPIQRYTFTYVNKDDEGNVQHIISCLASGTTIKAAKMSALETIKCKKGGEQATLNSLKRNK